MTKSGDESLIPDTVADSLGVGDIFWHLGRWWEVVDTTPSQIVGHHGRAGWCYVSKSQRVWRNGPPDLDAERRQTRATFARRKW